MPFSLNAAQRVERTMTDMVVKPKILCDTFVLHSILRNPLFSLMRLDVPMRS